VQYTLVCACMHTKTNEGVHVSLMLHVHLCTDYARAHMHALYECHCKLKLLAGTSAEVSSLCFHELRNHCSNSSKAGLFREPCEGVMQTLLLDVQVLQTTRQAEASKIM